MLPYALTYMFLSISVTTVSTNYNYDFQAKHSEGCIQLIKVQLAHNVEVRLIHFMNIPIQHCM